MAGQPVQPSLIQFKSDTSVSLDDMQAQHTQLNETLTALQLRAQSPPEDVSERNAWATQVKEDSLALVKKYDDLAAVAMEAAASGKPGAIDIYAKVNDSLESCATCHKLVDIALERWSAEQSFKLCEESELEAHKDKATVLDRSEYNSVSKAADDLQAGSTKCPEGYCIVFSTNATAYFVLYRSDKKEAAFDLFNFKEAEPELSWRESAGRAHGDDGYHFGDLSRSIAKHAKAGIKDWAGKEKTKEGYEFGDLFLKPLARMFLGGSSSEVDAELEEKAKNMKEMRQKAHDMLQKYVMLIELRQKEIERNQLGGELRQSVNGVGGTFGRKYRKALEQLDVSIQSDPEITAEFVKHAQEHGDLKNIEDSLQSVLQVAMECEATARQMGAVADEKDAA